MPLASHRGLAGPGGEGGADAPGTCFSPCNVLLSVCVCAPLKSPRMQRTSRNKDQVQLWPVSALILS